MKKLTDLPKKDHVIHSFDDVKLHETIEWDYKADFTIWQEIQQREVLRRAIKLNATIKQWQEGGKHYIEFLKK